MDEATARLIIELQNQDIEELLKESHEETTEQASIDHDLALSIYKTELSDRATILGDRRMARSICLANLRDGATITAQRALEQQTVDDRSAAARMVNLLPPPVPANHRAQVNVEEQSVHLIPQQEQPAGPKQSCDTSESGGSKNGNSQFLQDPIDERIARLLQEETLRILEATPKIECVACTDSFVTAHLVKLPCQHHYCKECVPRFFENAIQHEGSWPPRCRNQRIPMIDVRRFLSNDLRARYAVKSLEWSTSNRTYGHEVTCSTFVPPDTIEDTCATCPICGRNTCTSCKRPQHDGACVEDQGLAQVRGLATENRWQRCYSCRRYVELNTGRNHITCYCRAQFCYVCAAQWKNCLCPIWDERRLLNRVDVIADRDDPQNPALRGAEAGRVANQLLAVEECPHASFAKVRPENGTDCDECGDFHYRFLLRCRQLYLQVCMRCRHERI